MIALLAGAAALSAYHALIPTHWLPVVVISRTRGWSRRRTLATVTTVALAHAAFLLALGFGGVAANAALAGVGLEVTERVSSFLLIGFGVFLAATSFMGHKHTRSRAGAGFLLLPLLTPCESLVPLFISTAPWGTGVTLLVGATFLTVTVPLQTLLAALALRGFSSNVLARINTHERAVMGTVLIATGFLLPLV